MTNLDRNAIRGLQLRNKISQGGITAERTAAGEIRISVNTQVDGRRVHRRGFSTLTEAREFIEQARTDARHGRLNLPAGRKLALTFAAAADQYLQRMQQSDGKNLVAKRRQLRLYLVPAFGQTRLDGITAFTIESYKKRRVDAGATPATVNRELATLSHLFNRAVEWKWLDRLPARPKKFAETGGRIIALDDQQCADLMRAAIASADPDLYLFVSVALNTGMRHGEIIAMRWVDLDLDRRRLFVPKAKAGQRVQPITAELADLLRREREMRDDREGWVFPSPHSDSQTGHRTHIKRPFANAARAAGLDPDLVTPHVLRHTAITKLVQAGIDLPTIQRISGHKTMAMVLRYTHVHGDHIDAAIAALGTSLQRAKNEQARETSPKLHHTDFEAKGRNRLPN
jgi:integrase